MTRLFRTIPLACLVGCAALPTPSRIDAANAPPRAFEVPTVRQPEPVEVWHDPVDAREYLAQDFVDFPGPLIAAPLSEDSRGRAPILEILDDFVTPDDGISGSLNLEEHRIVARVPRRVLPALQSALRALKENRDRMVHINVRFYSLAPTALARFGNLHPVRGGLAGAFERDILSAALSEASGPAGLLQSPKLTTFHGQKSHVMFLSQRPFVSGYVREGTGTARQLGTTTDGVEVEVRAVLNGDQDGQSLFTVDAHVAGTPEFLTASTAEGAVEFPQQSLSRLKGLFTLRPGQALLLVMPAPDPGVGEHRLLAVMVTLDWAN